MGQGMVSCIAAWHVKSPQLVVMHGAATDNNATLFAQGYNGVLTSYFKSGKYKDVVNTAGTWDPPDGPHRVHSGLHGAQQHQRRPDPERRDRRADHQLPQEPRREGQDVPDDRPGRDAHRSAERALGLPVRNRLQADLRRGTGRGRARDLPAGGQDAAERAGQRLDAGHDGEQERPVGPSDPGVGHSGEHEAHDRQGQLRSRRRNSAPGHTPRRARPQGSSKPRVPARQNWWNGAPSRSAEVAPARRGRGDEHREQSAGAGHADHRRS